MSIKKLFAVTLACAVVAVGSAWGQDVNPCTQTAKLSQTASGVQTYTSNSSGNRGLPGSPYGYEMWTEGGNNNKLVWFGTDQGGGAAFRTEWNNPNDYLGRIGFFMNEGKAYTQYNHMYTDYNYTRSANGTGGGYSYIGLYGWTKKPQVEWYIVEDWFGSGILSSSGILGTYKGEFTSWNGDKYKIYRNTRPAGSGNILNDGQAFPQYFSVRQRNVSNNSACGSIYVNEHFAKFEEYNDMKMGTDLYEVKFLVEAGGGTGWWEASYLRLTKETSKRDGSGTDPDPCTGPNCGTTDPPGGGKDTPTDLTWGTTGSGNLLKTAWTLNAGTNYGNSKATGTVAGGNLTVDPMTQGTESYQPQLVQTEVPLEAGKTYTLTFDAKTVSGSRDIVVVAQKIGEGSTGWDDYTRETVGLTATSKQVSVTITIPSNVASNTKYQIAIDLGGSNTGVVLSNPKLVANSTTSILPGGGLAVRGNAPAVSVKGRMLNVSSPVSSDLAIRVIDVSGKVRANFTASGGGRFSLDKVPAGRYFVEVKGVGVKQMSPVVVK